MYGLLKSLSRAAHSQILSYRGYVARVMYHASGCDKKTYRGVTCRRTKQGFKTKKRDIRTIHRTVLTGLLK